MPRPSTDRDRGTAGGDISTTLYGKVMVKGQKSVFLSKIFSGQGAEVEVEKAQGEHGLPAWRMAHGDLGQVANGRR